MLRALLCLHKSGWRHGDFDLRQVLVEPRAGCPEVLLADLDRASLATEEERWQEWLVATGELLSLRSWAHGLASPQSDEVSTLDSARQWVTASGELLGLGALVYPRSPLHKKLEAHLEPARAAWQHAEDPDLVVSLTQAVIESMLQRSDDD